MNNQAKFFIGFLILVLVAVTSRIIFLFIKNELKRKQKQKESYFENIKTNSFNEDQLKINSSNNLINESIISNKKTKNVIKYTWSVVAVLIIISMIIAYAPFWR